MEKKKMLATLRSVVLAGAAATALSAAGFAPALASSTMEMTTERGSVEAPLSVVRDPTDLPPPIAQRGPQKVTVELEAVEVVGKLDDGSVYHYWTFNGKVPGPFVRVRVGDTVDVHLKNSADSNMIHSAAPARARFRTADKIALRDNTDQFPRLVDRSPLSGSPA